MCRVRSELKRKPLTLPLRCPDGRCNEQRHSFRQQVSS